MSRPPEPQKKEELLEKCLAAVIETGSLDSSINVIAKRIGTSGRMLVYHFGSKQELENQVIGLLERRLRDQLWLFEAATQNTDVAEPLIKMWQHLTSKQMYGLMKLTMEFNQRAVQGDEETRQFLEQANQEWIEALTKILQDEESAVVLLHLFQGAILDYLATGNAERGEQTIINFMKMRSS